MTGPNMFRRNGSSRYPGSPAGQHPSNASPPNQLVGTAMSRIAAKIREASDIAQLPSSCSSTCSRRTRS